ncbi:riboflavin biosynthesis protein RibF [Salmonella enterica subsp. arizonae]|uniref:riboflavin kinase n=1 Tax=Salmonella enterica subsp. arizonae TaxID=59203 RepID=A0A2X4TKA7_SALER|nr:riboflavin biosynthesis protein RibF [Salmonella enterica subsp. arizonae]
MRWKSPGLAISRCPAWRTLVLAQRWPALRQQLEVHLLDVVMDLYGRHIDVILRKKIRNEQRFASLDELKAQIARDELTARKFFGLAGQV